MKKWALLMLMGFWVWVSGTWAYTLEGKVKAKVDFKEELRYEYWETFDTGAPQKDEDYAFGSSKMRLGVGFSSPVMEGYVQFHWTQFLSLPDDGQFGLGMLYYNFNGAFGPQGGKATNIGYGALAQAWVKLKPPQVPGLSLKAGRFLYLSGLEGGLPGDQTLRWVKKVRISQRMIGPFDWSRVGRAFDGALLSYNRGPWNLTLSYMHPTPGGFYLRRDDTEVNGESTHDLDLATVVLSLRETNPWLPHLEAQVFYYYYNDERRLPGLNPMINGLGDCEVHMLGGHTLYAHKLGPGTADFLLWGGYQWGTWGRHPTLDHHAWAVALEGGYRFERLPGQPWFRVGYFYGTGDDDPGDRDHETFFMMIPTLRIYSMTPSYTFMNTKYWMAQVILRPLKKMVVRSDLHLVDLTEDEDYWYLGSGLMRPDVLSYAAVGAHLGKNHDDLLTLWDLSIFLKDLYRYNGLKVGLDLYVSHIWGGDVVEDRYPEDDDLTFFYAELRFVF